MLGVIYTLFFLIGLVVGSFVNVLVIRFGTGKGVMGRSRCYSCARHLSYLDMIPVVSYILLRGRCGSCKSLLSVQYPIVEVLTGALFALVAYTFFNVDAVAVSFFSIILLLPSVALIVAISVYDVRHKIIPNAFVYSLIALALIYRLLLWGVHGAVFSDGVITVALFLFFASLWFFSGGRWMGLGDGKFALAMGLLLGFPAALWATVLSIWAGALFGLALILLSHTSLGMKSQIPLAPFLAFGTLTFLFVDVSLVPTLLPFFASLFS